ncbi:MAG: SPOR domain-containing protein [Burkholderiales bacterium]
MKRSMNAQEQALRAQSRRRMIGAAVIMLCVVLLLPMILDHSMEPKFSAHGLSEVQMDALHNRDQIDPAVTARPDLPQPAAAETVIPPVPPAASAPPAEPSDTPETAAIPAPATTAPSVPPAVAATAPSAGKAVFWVQVGVFKDRGKAQALVKKLADHEIQAIGEEAHYKDGVRVRVRIGPLRNKAEALATTHQIEQLGIKSIIIAP